ncbi:hypothetical protein V0U79_08565 [Hyphobacterium sp. HN65]|uniref:Imelysin-like domain-containing protein n=1 Tax=Hyphobacterium lacteum TaxID=3116575 RepID=A0ABU7LR91_9PROT|nr:hypothetical protein [Hyphobacterium sp. HN65]MEE2526417.1 hypothetical protein [Hyphobacterium sp. HN65]
MVDEERHERRLETGRIRPVELGADVTNPSHARDTGAGGRLARAAIILFTALTITACSHHDYEFSLIDLDESTQDDVTNIRAKADELLRAAGAQPQTRFRHYDAPAIATTFGLAANTLFDGGEEASLGLGLVGTLITGLRGYDQNSAWRRIYSETALSLYCIAEEISPFIGVDEAELRTLRDALQDALRVAETFDFPQGTTAADRRMLADTATQARAAIALLESAINNTRNVRSDSLLAVRGLESRMIERVDNIGSNPSNLINALQSYGGAIAEDSNRRIVASGGERPTPPAEAPEEGDQMPLAGDRNDRAADELSAAELANRLYDLSRAAADATSGLTTLGSALGLCTAPAS